MEDYEPLLVETTVIKSSETESIRPITVYQALQAERLPNDVQFSLGGAKFDKVLLVTHAMLRDTSDARGAYDLDDGTGMIYGSWVNKAGLDHAMFSAMIHQFDNSLACVMGNIVQRGQRKMVNIESMVGAGYHQAMYHALDCMRTSLMIEKHKGQAHNTDEMLVVQELKEDVEDSIAADSRAFEQSYRSFSFFDLPHNDEGRNVSSPQTLARPFLQYGDHSEGLSSASTSKQSASQLPALPLALKREPPHSSIVRVAHPCTVTRTPSPLSSFGSSLQISSHYTPQYYSQLAQLTATQLAIVSILNQPKADEMYGIQMLDVYKRVRQVIKTTEEEFSTDIEWLLEEIYIFSPLDDDRIALTPRASV
ncbi:uncharacterized protein F5891DRAFT_1006719 [Suillus fuscotomentosus]|uniref:Uncharacterized protein n=1 Tax=Suillus fuscotomentosus TaxID=1912939 RepID=A0AAD4HRF0_9AGAM|nr:uncharacterized protein F5891DRAFT_1006719 [Suillus fuscotomentosus]KAG1905816.1 hypothetical protein F5891DRAFT_1006719 [Suillus fuscotomentosus]